MEKTIIINKIKAYSWADLKKDLKLLLALPGDFFFSSFFHFMALIIIVFASMGLLLYFLVLHPEMLPEALKSLF